jgi:acetyl-CoA carboxylase biotin carboxylase subunit
VFKKLLIANRGEIANRIIKSSKKLGIKPVCIYSETDKDMNYLSHAHESVCIGESSLKESYLNEGKILAIAEKYNCDAIHPGYGFFSENYMFSMKCKQQKITFIGPDSRFLKIMGNKLIARNTMKQLGIPVIPGSFSSNSSDKDTFNIANEIGYPILIKAVAGGGGKGIKLINNLDELKRNLSLCRFEAKNLFGNDEIYIEKFISNARHIEIQIAGDTYGNVIHFHERDCSIQRNNQKVLEEACAPNTNKSKLDDLKQDIIESMKLIGYDSLGTLEFLLDSNGNYYFIEANTRVQVEHPVTEMLTQTDLIDLQIRVALGDYINIRQSEIKCEGHVIECRINAEDPKKNFMPSTGKITELYFPKENKNIRIDTYINNGTEITPYYDSMIAKIIVHSEIREKTIKIMKKTLNKINIEGIFTSINMHKYILENKQFLDGKYTCQFLKDNMKSLIKC